MNTNKIGGKYELIHPLGEGAFGRAYRAKDQNGNEYAVKKLIFSRDEQSKFDLAKRLFQREVKTLKKLNGHRNIPKFVDYIEEDQQLYLIQQYINGKTLREELDSRKVFTVDEAFQILTTLLDILVYIHEKNVIHRDIKPDNIMLDAQGNLFLIDFGAVKEKILNATQSQVPATQIYTKGYAPEEQEKGYPKKNSDIYALGITIIELITGLKPTDMGNNWHTQANFSDDLKNILRKMIHDEYTYRYQSAKDVISDLQNPQAHSGTTIIQTNQSNNVDTQSEIDMILFSMLFAGILIIIVHAVMLPSEKKKEHQDRRSLLLEKMLSFHAEIGEAEIE